MEVLANIKNTVLKEEILKLYQQHQSILNDDNLKKINSINVYNENDDKNDFNRILHLFESENNDIKNYLQKNRLIYIKLLSAPPNCEIQFFHLDYDGTTISFFIPLTDLTDLNGTEFLKFKNEQDYIKHHKLMMKLTTLCLDKNDLLEELKKYDLYLNKDYTINIANANKFDIIKMPYYTFHRGQKNKTNEHRVIFTLVFQDGVDDFNYLNISRVLDEERDDEPDKITYLDNNRIIEVI